MNVIQGIFTYIVWFLSTYFVLVFFLLILKYRKKLFLKKHIKRFKKFPSVTVLVPVFNEEKNIIQTIMSLRKLNYSKDKLTIMVINDGSTDKTSKVVKKFLKNDRSIVFIDNKKNKGKAACLNQGIKRAKSDLIVCMDADTTVEKQILQNTVHYFTDKTIGAVTVMIDTKPQNFLQKVTRIEYFIGLSLSLSLLSKIGAVHVTPGPFTIFRKKLFDEIGGFDEKSITEDLEIAYRIQKAGYKIEVNLDTKVYTVVPDNLKKLYKQRKRWYTGAIQTLFKHKDVLFSKERGFFGIFIPYNFLLIILGVFLFFFSMITSMINSFNNIRYYYLTNYNFFEQLKYFEIDILSMFNIFSILVLISLFVSIIMTISGIKSLNKNIRENYKGIIGFMYLFILYQLFWAASFYAVVFKRRVKWR